MKDKDIVRDLAVKYNLDRRVVSTIVRSPFLFVRDKIEDLQDVRAIRIPYFGLFSYKITRTVEDKYCMLLNKAIKELRSEGDKSSDESYVKGINKAIDIIRNLIINRKGKPEDYGIEESQEQ